MKNQKIYTRILALILFLAVCISIVPYSVLADDSFAEETVMIPEEFEMAEAAEAEITAEITTAEVTVVEETAAEESFFEEIVVEETAEMGCIGQQILSGLMQKNVFVKSTRSAITLLLASAQKDVNSKLLLVF